MAKYNTGMQKFSVNMLFCITTLYLFSHKSLILSHIKLQVICADIRAWQKFIFYKVSWIQGYTFNTHMHTDIFFIWRERDEIAARVLRMGINQNLIISKNSCEH